MVYHFDSGVGRPSYILLFPSNSKIGVRLLVCLIAREQMASACKY